MRSSLVYAALFASILAGCDEAALATPPAPPQTEGATPRAAPEGSPPGTCWERDTTPAVFETVTQTELVQPAEVLADGTVVSNAIYRTERRRAIVVERRDIWFEITCDTMKSHTFVATLQRALKARGLFHGPVTGIMDWRTSRAVRRYQAPLGLDSAVLSLQAARKLGLVAVQKTPKDP